MFKERKTPASYDGGIKCEEKQFKTKQNKTPAYSAVSHCYYIKVKEERWPSPSCTKRMLLERCTACSLAKLACTKVMQKYILKNPM